jgi:quercetin dioxygenase-like cupin family protein
MSHIYRSVGFWVLAGLIAAPSFGWSQQMPPGVRSQAQFAGAVTMLLEGKQRSIPVSERTWALAPGSNVKDLRLGGQGNLVVEVQSGILTTTIDGQKQIREAGDFFVVPANQNAVIAPVRDRSVVLHTLLLPAE